MNPNEAVDLARQAMVLIVIVACPVLLVGLVVGLVMALFQAVTQIHEQILGFVPKIIAMLLGLIVFGPWMITRIVEFGRVMFQGLP